MFPNRELSVCLWSVFRSNRGPWEPCGDNVTSVSVTAWTGGGGGSQKGCDGTGCHGGWLRVWQDGRVQFKYLLVWDAPLVSGARVFEWSPTWHARGNSSGPGAAEVGEMDGLID